MDDKQQEFIEQLGFTNLVDFIHKTYGIELQPYQLLYLKSLTDKNCFFSSGAASHGKTFLVEKYLEFKQKYPNANHEIETTTTSFPCDIIFDELPVNND